MVNSRALLALLSCFLGACASVPSRKPDDRGFDVIAYHANIVPDIRAGTLQGSLKLRWKPTAIYANRIILDRYARMTIASVSDAGQALAFRTPQGKLEIDLPSTQAPTADRELTIVYQSTPGYGLQMHHGYPQIYSLFSTSQWMPVVDAPDERATLDLSVTLPADLVFTSNGEAVSNVQVAGDQRVHRWKIDRQIPSYVYGFAAAKFTEAQVPGHIPARVLGVGFNKPELQQIFADTQDMLAYFTRRAGVAYPGTAYTQALVVETVGQEHADFSLLSEEYGRSVLADPRAQGLIAHEAAHQWWGNSITCRDWRHFWLNEGFATFLAASYMQHRFGDAAYQTAVSGWERRLADLRLRGADKPLVFDAWHKPSADDRGVVYQKGAYVLHRLRLKLGERKFWRGLRDYSRRYFDRSVTTQDFQRAMEKSSGQSLDDFFAHWAYPPKT